ncbi:unnamed protein product [Prorocentrum cordatum]|uniref:EGF-like domain-containing protein n=1 Tax=Prorocentrum cordatum TaxID=2364126 RepID=A0ABN9TGX6_9DINO|nr:unnamed protein product [Polarella glacialis]
MSCGSSGYFGDYGQECICDAHGSSNCVNPPERYGEHGDVCAEGAECKCDGHCSCECNCDAHGSCNCLDRPSLARGRSRSGANLTQPSRCGKQGEVCAQGTGCKYDGHGSCACSCGSSGYLCHYGQECSFDAHGSYKCVDKPSCSADQRRPLARAAYNIRDVEKSCGSGTEHQDQSCLDQTGGCTVRRGPFHLNKQLPTVARAPALSLHSAAAGPWRMDQLASARRWTGLDGEYVASVAAGAVVWPDGSRHALEPAGGGALRVVGLPGAAPLQAQARLVSAGRLEWSDGDVWLLEAPPPAPGTAGAGSEAAGAAEDAGSESAGEGDASESTASEAAAEAAEEAASAPGCAEAARAAEAPAEAEGLRGGASDDSDGEGSSSSSSSPGAAGGADVRGAVRAEAASGPRGAPLEPGAGGCRLSAPRAEGPLFAPPAIVESLCRLPVDERRRRAASLGQWLRSRAAAGGRGLGGVGLTEQTAEALAAHIRARVAAAEAAAAAAAAEAAAGEAAAERRAAAAQPAERAAAARPAAAARAGGRARGGGAAVPLPAPGRSCLRARAARAGAGQLPGGARARSRGSRGRVRVMIGTHTVGERRPGWAGSWRISRSCAATGATTCGTRAWASGSGATAAGARARSPSGSCAVRRGGLPSHSASSSATAAWAAEAVPRGRGSQTLRSRRRNLPRRTRASKERCLAIRRAPLALLPGRARARPPALPQFFAPAGGGRSG